MLVGAEEQVSRTLTVLDVWDGRFYRLEVGPAEGCPTCGGRYEFLGSQWGTKTTSLCGQNSVQVMSTRAAKLSFSELARRLEPLGAVSFNDFLLRFNVDGHEMVVFADGRAIVKGTSDEATARGLYAKYIGA
jgi:adenylyltransferase/sulfurtransferase